MSGQERGVGTRLPGRERELEAVRERVRRVARGRGGALVVRGEAGIGKSALLAEAEALAREAGAAVLHTAGAPDERALPFAALQRLLRPRAGPAAALPEPQRDALAVAFGLGPGPPPGTFLVGLATLEVLADAGAERPLLVLVEDAQWLDAATADVLAFVARRVDLEPVLLLFALRHGHVARLEDARLAEIVLGPLDDESAERVLDAEAPGLPADERRRVLDVAAGNPLALVELPRALGDGAGRAGLLAPLPLTDRLERAFSDRIAELPRPTRTLLLAAALDEGGDLARLLEAATAVGPGAVGRADLAPAEEAGLVSVEGGGVRFRRALVRAAVHAGAVPAERRALHAALADAHAADRDRSAWHRAASVDGPDDDAAAALEGAARSAFARGAPDAGAAALERASQLTADPARRGRLLLRAAETEFELGRATRALQLLGDARALDLEDGERLRLTFLADALDEATWSGAAGTAAFVELAQALTAAGEPRRALAALELVAVRCWWDPSAADAGRLVAAAARQTATPADDPQLLSVAALADPVGQGATVLEALARLEPDGTDPVAMLRLGTSAAAVWAHDRAPAFLTAGIDGLRAQGRLGLLAQALVSQAWAYVHLARAGLAVSAAEEASRLARETGQLRWALAADLALAALAAERGDLDAAAAATGEAEALLLPMGAHALLSLVQFVRGRGATAHQDYEAGLEHLRRILDPGDLAYQPNVGAWALADLVEAAAHLDRTDEARGYLERLESLAAGTSAPLLQAQAAYARPLVAADDEAEEHYQAALSSGLTAWPCYRGRLLLAYGRWLRRRRRIAESRAPVRAARETFDALGLLALAETARAELRASGETSRPRTPDVRERLTPQELHIARLAADGLSNREIGQRLYLSHRTVGSHLYRIFPKLGVTSRAQLAGALQSSD